MRLILSLSFFVYVFKFVLFLQKENNIQESFVYVDRKPTDAIQQENSNLNESKKQRLLEKRLLSIWKEIFVFLLFLFFLNWVTFSNLSQSSYQYNQLFIANFVKQQSQNEIGLEYVRKNILKNCEI